MKKSINIKKNKIGYYNFKKIPHLDKLEKYYKEKYFSKNISYKDKLLSSEKLYLKVHALITVPNDFSFLQKTTNKVVKKNRCSINH